MSLWMVDFVIALLAVEALVLSRFLVRREHGALVLPLLLFLASGGLLLIVLRAALGGEVGMALPALLLLSSGVCQGASLYMAYQRFR